jgi:hypothetical protein
LFDKRYSSDVFADIIAAWRSNAKFSAASAQFFAASALLFLTKRRLPRGTRFAFSIFD